jgi:3-oxoacyl-[acyl-carrier-protein] synthase-3
MSSATQYRSAILGLGTNLPDRVVTNNDLKQWMDTSDEWIVERTGIRERRWVPEGSGIGPAELAAPAVEKALAQAGITKDQVGMIVFATLSPESEFPSSGCYLHGRLGMKPVPVFDIREQCTGFIYGLSLADQYIRSGTHEYILVVGGEVHSTGLDLSTRGRDLAVLFGDGAGAVVMGRARRENQGVLSTHLYADGQYTDELYLAATSSRRAPRVTKEQIDAGDIYPKMNGRQVFKHAVTRMPEVLQEALKANHLTVNDVDCLIPHQANLRINEYVQKQMGLPDSKVHNNIQKYGNTTAATIPLVLEGALEAGKIKEGNLLAMVAFGSGFTWASALVRW